jgi:hypothetical protein
MMTKFNPAVIQIWAKYDNPLFYLWSVQKVTWSETFELNNLTRPPHWTVAPALH